MTRHWKHLLAGGLVAATATTAAAAPWIMRHGQSSAQYQNMYDNELPAGYRPISVNVNGSAANQRFTTVWVNDGVPFGEWAARHEMSPSEYQDEATTLAQAGFRVVSVDAVGTVPDEVYVAAWVRDSYGINGDWAATHAQTRTDLEALDQSYRDQGFRMTWISGYGGSNDRRFAAVWIRNFEGWSYTVDYDVLTADYQSFVAARCASGLRLVSVTAYDNPERFAMVWLRPDGDNWDMQDEWQARHGQTDPTYQQYVTDLYGTTWQSVCAVEYGSAGDPRYVSTWINDRGPLQWTQKGKNVPEMAPVDDAVEDFMKKRKIPHGQVAVTFEGRLIYNQGYTYAPADEPLTTVNSRFRIASIAKSLTAIAVMQLDEQGAFGTDGLDKLVSDYPVFENEQWCDTAFDQVTIRHLLQHTGGWDRDNEPNLGDPGTVLKCGGVGAPQAVGYFDPQFQDVAIDAELGTGFPVSELDIIDYMKNFNLNTPPGSAYEYSNFGYNLLGRVIESATGVPYEQWVRDNVLCPVGAEGMYMGGSTWGEIQAGEVPYSDPMQRCVTSVIDGTSLVPVCYGGWNQTNMGAHGGWVAKASELARVIADLEDKTDSVLLTEASIDAMWLPTSISNNSYGMGFQIGGSGRRYHNGSLPGSWCFMVRRSDGLTFTLLFNQNHSWFEHPEQDTGWDAYWDVIAALDAITDPATGAGLPAHDLFGVNRCGNPGGFTTPEPGRPSRVILRRP